MTTIAIIGAGASASPPPGEEHWHGATPDDFMEHLAMFDNSDDPNATTTRGQHVTNEEYTPAALPPTSSPLSRRSRLMTDQNQQPRQVGGGRGAIGDIAPKLAELTDGVLFDDVWNRTELAARDRSLITVAALVAGGDAAQLTFHLNHAKTNGVTETELIEAITHLAFYVGWPKAMTAITVARQVFRG